MSLFGRRPQPKVDEIQQAVANVEQILVGAGVNVEVARMAVDGHGWKFQYGSATIEIYITQKDHKVYFQVLSPIMHIPQAGLLPVLSPSAGAKYAHRQFDLWHLWGCGIYLS